MTEGNRQKKFSKLIQKELSHILQFEVASPADGLVTISGVRTTKDLSESRIYISVFPTQNRKPAIERLNDQAPHIRKLLASKIKNQVKQVPQIIFFEDDTLDYVEKMDNLFHKIEEEEKGKSGK